MLTPQRYENKQATPDDEVIVACADEWMAFPSRRGGVPDVVITARCKERWGDGVLRKPTKRAWKWVKRKDAPNGGDN